MTDDQRYRAFAQGTTFQRQESRKSNEKAANLKHSIKTNPSKTSADTSHADDKKSKPELLNLKRSNSHGDEIKKEQIDGQRYLASVDEPMLMELREAIRWKSKGVFQDGNVIIIIDVEDPAGSVRLPSSILYKLPQFIPLLKHAVEVEAQIEGKPELLQSLDTSSGLVDHLFILQKPTEANVLPKLTAINPYSTLQAFTDDYLPIFLNRNDCPKTVSESEKSTKKLATDHRNKANTSQASSTSGKNTWPKVFEIFFRMIANYAHDIPKRNATAALPLIEEVLFLANNLDSTFTVKASFSTLFNGYIAHRSLWQAIADDPIRWLLIGLDLQEILIYNEAFIHVAGNFSAWPWSTPKTKIPEAILAAMSAKYERILRARASIDQSLSLLNFLKRKNLHIGKRSKTEITKRSSSAVAYEILALWRDWVLGHLAELYSTSQERTKFPHDNCKHSSEECLTVAGFYRILAQSGDAYLPTSFLTTKTWAKRVSRGDEGDMHSDLNLLKQEAANLVTPLVTSSLQFEGRAKLGYLTCIKVEDSDIPWEHESEG